MVGEEGRVEPLGRYDLRKAEEGLRIFDKGGER